MAKTIIVSNRLPVKIQKKNNELTFKPSEGGLATGLGSIYKEGKNLWLGWPGLYINNEDDRKFVRKELKKENMQPVFLSKAEIKDYYEGFSNGTLWPIFHYFSQFVIHNDDYWNAYKKVNLKFAKEVIKQAEPDDTIWIHDYQLLLLPELIRKKLPNINIGFFLHIPFPSFEVFRQLPWREDILKGMLGSDLIGFHTYDDMRHFLTSIERIVGLRNIQGQVENDNRILAVDAFPMGIDYEKYESVAQKQATLDRESKYRGYLNVQKLIISIDRLDYSKGIPERLHAFETFLERNTKYHGKVSLFMIVVPSRDKVETYKRLKEEIDETVGRINSRFGKISWRPVHYFYRSYPLEALSALYKIADIGLVTSMRDGMNLVAKEFIASKTNQQGVLIISEFAGASRELSDAIVINPNDKNQIIDALCTALEMPVEEQKRRMRIMQNTLKRYNIHHWVSIFMERLRYIKEKQDSLSTKNIDNGIRVKILADYNQAEKRLLLFDYDGTLIQYENDPKKAKPDKELIGILSKLSSEANNKIVLISGRERGLMENWFNDLEIDLIAEYGAWVKTKGSDWTTIEHLTNEWKSDILPVLEHYVNRTPGSLIEEKEYSLVWHYRRVASGFGDLRARELINHLTFLASNINLHVIEGEMTVAVKNIEINKGKAAMKWIEKYYDDYIMAIGDNAMGEEIFKVLPEQACSIKIGSSQSIAKYSLQNPKATRQLLKNLIK